MFSNFTRHFLRFLFVALVCFWVLKSCFAQRVVDAVSFNVENFPKSTAQIDGAFRVLRGLEPELVGVQEIRKPTVFATEARRRLGERWQAVWPEPSPRHHVGLLYDSEVFEYLGATTHEGTVVEPRAKPTLEVRLRRRDSPEDAPPLAALVVHLKAYDAGLPVRQKQYRALDGILNGIRSRGDRIVLMGDFNSTRPEDRTLLADLAGRHDLRWTTRGAQCTGYWRPGGQCTGTALDHILTSAPGPKAHARGPCSKVGCEPGDSCPIFYHDVSDHCPVRAPLAP